MNSFHWENHLFLSESSLTWIKSQMKTSAYVLFGKTGVTIFEFDISLERPSASRCGFVVCLLRCRYCIIWIGSNRTTATKIGGCIPSPDTNSLKIWKANVAFILCKLKHVSNIKREQEFLSNASSYWCGKLFNKSHEAGSSYCKCTKHLFICPCNVQINCRQLLL